MIDRELVRRCAMFETSRQSPPFLIAWFWIMAFTPRDTWTAHGVDVRA